MRIVEKRIIGNGWKEVIWKKSMVNIKKYEYFYINNKFQNTHIIIVFDITFIDYNIVVDWFRRAQF